MNLPPAMPARLVVPEGGELPPEEETPAAEPAAEAREHAQRW